MFMYACLAILDDERMHLPMKYTKFLALIMILIVLMPLGVGAQGRSVIVLTYDGPVTPAMLAYLERGLAHAEEVDATAVIFMLDTPGGSVDITQDISQAIQQSPVPVIVYVAPARAWAASAGALITLSGHMAVMAPETLIGAASPVDSSGADLPETAQRKAEEALAATARSLAARRGDDAVQWAEQIVLSAEAATAEEALELGAVDAIASDIPDLLRQLDGRVVMVGGVEQTLALEDVQVEPFHANVFEQLLGILSNPAVAVILLTLGINAILYELSAPGGYVAGAVGIIALLLAFYSLGTLQANFAGLAFVVVAFALFIIDLKAGTGGALTAAGLVAFVLGVAMLFDSSYVAVPWGAITGATLAVTLFVLIALRAIARTQRSRPYGGGDALVGMVGSSRSILDPNGMVYLMGAWWEATSEGGMIDADTPIVVTRREGHHLWVRQTQD